MPCSTFLSGMAKPIAFTILFSTYANILDAVDADCVEESDELKEGRGELE